jgi:hypothetical protein
VIYWIGGSPCSGKTTIADRLAARFGLRIYRCDDAYYVHEKLITEQQPIFHKLTHATTDEIWLRPVDRQIAEELEIYREEFPFILADLEALPDDRPILAEGAALLPELIAAHGVPLNRCIWIVPTEDFQRHHYAQRDWRHDVLATCSNPEQGWKNWMSRDAGFAAAVAAQAIDLNFRLIVVDGSLSIDENDAIVVEHFGLG